MGGYNEDIPAIFRVLDVFIHPCETEPFGRVVIEAMASKLPIIVPDEGGSCEPINNGVNGIYYKAKICQKVCPQIF